MCKYIPIYVATYIQRITLETLWKELWFCYFVVVARYMEYDENLY